MKKYIILGLAVLVVAAGLWYSRNRPIADSQLLLRLNPTRAVIVSLNVQALRQAGILDLLAGTAGSEEPEYKQFVAQTGFDYRTDLDSALLGFRDSQNLYYLRGRFDMGKLKRYAEANGGSCGSGRCTMAGSNPQRPISFTEVRPGLLAMHVGGERSTLLEMLKDAPQGPLAAVPGQPLWSWIPAAVLEGQAPMPTGTRAFASALKGAEHIQLTLGAEGTRFAAGLEVRFKEPPEAALALGALENTTAMLNKLIARENQQANPKDLSGVLTAGKFRREERTVYGTWPIERAFLETLAGGGVR